MGPRSGCHARISFTSEAEGPFFRGFMIPCSDLWKMQERLNVKQLWIFLLVIESLTVSLSAQDGRNSEVAALIQVKLSLNDPQGSLKAWDINAVDPCTWAHVRCDGSSVIRLDLPNQQLSGTLSPWIGNLSNLQYLTLQKNNLFGTIPPELGKLSKLQSLDLSNNSFSGNIPSALCQLTSVSQLNLDNNKLSGPIPASFASLSSLRLLDLSFNNLSGPVPTIAFANFNIEGNPFLCGFPAVQVCPGDPPTPTSGLASVPESRTSKKSRKGIMVCGLSVVATLLIASVSCGIAWWRRHYRKQVFFDVNEQENPHMPLGQLKKFSFRELQIATDNFSSRNILGKGGFGNVYKGCLSDGSLVAVKRLREEGTPGGELQFQMEVEMISLAVHRNLLRLRGFCMTPTERLLVYPYMSNGSVASRLRGTKNDATYFSTDTLFGKPALDWATRKRIALGAGRGLLYLHEHCDPKIIHRDVKAANVLLDEDFEAVVGDFGLAKLLDHQDSHVTTAVRGTVGHIAPEYLSTGQSSEKTDVFGFGILLLELITGQRAFDFGRISSNKDVMLLDWVKKLQHEKRLELLVDVDLRQKYNAVELEEMVQVALLCTQVSPTDRPKMGEVVRMLEGDGLAERWEAWRRVENRRSQESVSMPRKYYELVEDSTFDLEAIQLSGPR